jgi:integral membrane protein
MDFNAKKSVNRFRKVAVLEGWSFVLLLFLAMPLKYLFDMPLFVKYLGWAHGILFVGYMITLIQATINAEWKFGKLAWAFIASFIPFGTFILDKQLKSELEM